jgi:hypothetical protein
MGLFATFTEHYSKLDAVSKLMLQPQSTRRLPSSMLTPKRLPQQTSAKPTVTIMPSAAGTTTTIASMPWAWALHSLFRIINELPNQAELINKFIYNEIDDPNQVLMDLMMEKTAKNWNHFCKFA